MTKVHADIAPAVPVQWQVNGLQLSGLSWGQEGDKPLLALHGWLDNAASFACLAPLLPGYHVVALDLTGHGRSSRRSPDASYQIWDDLPEILGVLDQLGWERFALMGHSRGAIISTLLASSFPERVERLVLLDAVYPMAVAEEEFPAQMRRALEDKPRLLDRRNRVFPSEEQAIASRQERGLPAAAAALLTRRNLGNCAEGLTWTTDPRLYGASAVKLTEGQVRAALQALTMPALLLIATDAARDMSVVADDAQRYVDKLVVASIKGGHHFHMEAGVADVAHKIAGFLRDEEGCQAL